MEKEKVGGVITNKGRIEAPIVINAAGPWAGIVANMAGLTMPIKLIRGQILAVKPRTKLTRVVPMTVDMNTGFYFREETGGLLLLGKLDKAFHVDRGHIDPDDYYEYKEKPDDEFKDFIVERVDQKLPSLNDSHVVRGWVGLRTVTPDSGAGMMALLLLVSWGIRAPPPGRRRGGARPAALWQPLYGPHQRTPAAGRRNRLPAAMDQDAR